MDSILDYTKMRKGRRIGAGRIAVCGKCGRKGLRKEMRFKSGRGWLQFDHVVEDSDSGLGFVMRSAKEFCTMPLPDAPARST